MTDGPGRDPYRDVKRQLRREVGFACPVAGCGNPYLTWHHFDPPWRVEHHHRPEGMIALCLEHAHQADNSAFTDDQLRALKRVGGVRSDAIGGRFNWMRREVLVRVGGNFYFRTPVIFEIGSIPCIWLSRDEDDNLLVSFRMPTISGQPRASIIENFWSVPADVDEIVCPPMGRLIEVSYRNGDRFKAEFSEVANVAGLRARYPNWRGLGEHEAELPMPLTVVEIWETAAGTNLEFGPNHSQIGGVSMTEGFSWGNRVGLHVSVSDEELRALFSAEA